MGKNANIDIKHLRTLGHKLKPVVTVAGNGLSDNVIMEIDAALSRHELIKVKLAVGDREAKSAVTQEVCERTNCKVVQSIGNIILIMRRAPKPDPKLSNLIRTL